MLNRLKPVALTVTELEQELTTLIHSLQNLLGDSLLKVIQFGSSVAGVAQMHLDSDLDLCVILSPDSPPIKSFYGRLPTSSRVPVDWILVTKDEYDEQVKKGHGVFFLVSQTGKLIVDNTHGKI